MDKQEVVKYALWNSETGMFLAEGHWSFDPYGAVLWRDARQAHKYCVFKGYSHKVVVRAVLVEERPRVTPL